MMQNLGPKATSFRMGFDGAIKQFASRGYPPPRADTMFLSRKDALAEYPTEAFNL